jgi:hypothetical protein
MALADKVGDRARSGDHRAVALDAAYSARLERRAENLLAWMRSEIRVAAVASWSRSGTAESHAEPFQARVNARFRFRATPAAPSSGTEWPRSPSGRANGAAGRRRLCAYLKVTSRSARISNLARVSMASGTVVLPTRPRSSGPRLRPHLGFVVIRPGDRQLVQLGPTFLPRSGAAELDLWLHEHVLPRRSPPRRDATARCRTPTPPTGAAALVLIEVQAGFDGPGWWGGGSNPQGEAVSGQLLDNCAAHLAGGPRPARCDRTRSPHGPGSDAQRTASATRPEQTWRGNSPRATTALSMT